MLDRCYCFKSSDTHGLHLYKPLLYLRLNFIYNNYIGIYFLLDQTLKIEERRREWGVRFGE